MERLLLTAPHYYLLYVCSWVYDVIHDENSNSNYVRTCTCTSAMCFIYAEKYRTMLFRVSTGYVSYNMIMVHLGS